jgi:DNA excision repair protein ERCC-3
VVTSERAIAFQRSGMILLDAKRDPEGRIASVLSAFAELASAAGSMHSYRVTELSLWAAASSGRTADQFFSLFDENASSPVPRDLVVVVSRFFDRFGQLRLVECGGEIRLVSEDPLLLRQAASVLGREVLDGALTIESSERGSVKANLAQAGFPVKDDIQPRRVEAADFELRDNVNLRNYQHAAIEQYLRDARSGGVILLPCGAGKTVVGVAIAALLRAKTLVVVPNRTIGEQWAEHFKTLTTISPDDVSLFEDASGSRSVSIVTYQALTRQQSGDMVKLIDASTVPWGLVIYDEAHSLPADVFRQSAALQASRKLGLTATLVREDGREREVFALVGPLVWQSRWRELEREGWISPVECYEVRVPLEHSNATADRILGAKIRATERILKRHEDDRVLIAAHRLREVHALARRFDAPSITGQTPQGERRRMYDAFRTGATRRLVVSRVANVGVDLPEASVMIQVSGSFGSRLEEAQRLGRLIRPSSNEKPARFYTLVAAGTRERTFAERRQRFLVDQGYRYRVVKLGSAR